MPNDSANNVICDVRVSCVIKRYDMKAYCGSGGVAPRILTLCSM